MKFSISIVSHNSGKHLVKLFMDLSERFPPQAEVILTINTPEDEFYLNSAVGFPLKIIRNLNPLGFGANHNQAFSFSSGHRFLVVNPDIRIHGDPWGELDKVFDLNFDVGACVPRVISPTGAIEDSVRHFPTIGKLLKRVVLGIRHPDYISINNLTPIVVDWAGGMFVMFDSASFRSVGGFDTSYFMYLEDADICRRLGVIGKKILWVPSCNVVHDAQRASRKNWQHLCWHARSMVRFIFKI